MLPRWSACIAPPVPQRTSSRAGGSLTMVRRKPEAAATSCGDFASLAPAATSSSAREAVRFQTVRAKPALMRFSPIGRPIRPRPINPIFLGPAAGSKRSLLECGGREARRYFPQKEETIVAELGGRSSEGDVRRSWGAEGKGGCLESRRPPQRRSEARCAVRTRRELRVQLREAPEPGSCSRKLLGPAFLRCAPDIDREFPSENVCAGRVARSFVQGRWSGRNRRQRCRRRAEEYRQRDIALQPGAPDRLSNGPYCAQCRRPAVTGSIVRKDSL